MEECVFCKIASGEIPAWKVTENDCCIVFLDLEPVCPYHTLVIPKHHYSNIYDIPKEELHALVSTVQDVCQLYREKLGITNVQLINNSGPEAQQSVFHIHWHILPRSNGDGNNIILKKMPEMIKEYPQMLARLQ